MSDKKTKVIESINKLFSPDINDFIFIYTPPKVGSTTLVSSLRISLGKSYNVIHIHDEVMLSVLTGINDVTIIEIIKYLSSINKNVYVIDVYRTPIERKMSEFFEKISPYHFNNSEENLKNYSIKRISDRFNKVFPHIENGDHYFEKYNIETPVLFNFEKKYTIQEIENVKYIKLRLCDSSQWSIILTTIFQTDIVIIDDYTTERKSIGELYKRFKNEYKLPSNFFEEIKNNKYLNFYYSIEEINIYLNYWKNRMCDVFTSYTEIEYNFYINLCLENQYFPDIQIQHYIDNGCYCKYCSLKRRDIFFRSKNGEKIFEKIIHEEEVLNDKKNKVNNINEKIKMINRLNQSVKKGSWKKTKDSKFIIQLT